MDATLILIDNDIELKRAHELVEKLISSETPDDLARPEAQARLIAAYEERKWPGALPNLPDLLTYIMDQHNLTRADMAPILGTPSRVSEILSGKKGLSMAMVQRPRARFHIPADLLISSPEQSLPHRPAKASAKRTAA